MKASAILLAGAFFSCTDNSLEEVLEFSQDEEIPARSTIDVHYTLTDSGKVKNTLAAGKLDQYQTADTAYSIISDGFELVFFDDLGQYDGMLTAKNGTINGKTTIMVARDSVVFKNKMDETLRTEELTWYKDSAQVITDKFVTIERADVTIYGKGLTSNQNFTEYSINNVTGSFYLNTEDEKR